MKVSILTQESFYNWRFNRSGSSRIRGRWLVKYWDEASEFKIGEKPDVMIFQKAYWKEMMRDSKFIKILDICDPDFLEGPTAAGIVEMMGYCDACVTSTEPLAEEVRKYTPKPVVCIPDRFDLDEFNNPRPKHEGDPQKVIWWGYSHNAEVLERTYDVLRELSLKLTIVSDKNISEADYWFKYDWPTIHSKIKEHDIALMPNHPSRQYKSNNKTVEAWLCGLPVAQYKDDLERLMDSKARNDEVRKQRKFAIDNYDIRKSVEEYKELINTLMHGLQT
jgi:hypothetical protein